MEDHPTWDGGDQPASPPIQLVTGDSIGDNARHLLARAALFRLVINDDQTRELFRRWHHQTGIANTLLHARQTTTAIAAHYGFQNRYRLIEAALYPSRNPTEVRTIALATRQLIPIWTSLEAVQTAAQREYGMSLAGQVITFVKAVQLPYAWLALEILGYFYRDILLNPLGLPNSILIGLAGVTPHELPIELSGSRADLEAIRSSSERVQQQGGDINAVLRKSFPRNLLPATSPLRRGKVPKTTRDTIQRYTEWLYRVRMKRESVNSVAKSWQKTAEGKDRRKDVYDGVKEADRLLHLTPYRLDEDDIPPVGN